MSELEPTPELPDHTPIREIHLSAGAWASLDRGPSNEKMFECFASLDLRPHPMRLPSTAGPSFGRIFRVLIFRKHLWIRTSRPIMPASAHRLFNDAQSILELDLLRLDLASQRRSHLFVETPQLICRFGFQSIAFHEALPVSFRGHRA
jgi:hypothetical protein